MIFLNPLPNFFWFLLLIPIIIFIINNRINKTIRFSSIYLLKNLKSNQINKIKFLNIFLLIIRILIILFILLIIMRPHKKDYLSNLEVNQDKLINLIVIDDSFSNIYGSVNGINQSLIINDIIAGISKSYSIDSRIKIISLNRGLIFDGFNNNFILKNISEYNYSYIDLNKIINFENKNYHKNIHIISQFNDISTEKLNNFYENIQNDNYNFNFFFHSLPTLSNNQYIKEVKLINDLNQKFSNYEITLGNDSNKRIDLVLLGSKNLYNYDSKLYIDNTIPIYQNFISIPSNSIIVDTMRIDLDLKESFELFFQLESLSKNNQTTEWIDDRLEDNYYSYSFNVPEDINISVFYNDINSKNNLSSILDAFQINTKNIDSNFYKVDYILSEGLQKYSNINDNKNILLFLGYDIFEKSNNDVILNFLKRKKSQILIFPTKNNINKKKYSLRLAPFSFIDIFYKENPLNTYSNANFSKNFVSLSKINSINNFKISNYFYHPMNSNSILSINKEESLWSRYNIENGFIDLFGISINYGNNFFDDAIAYSIPLMYKIIVDDKINSNDNNLLMNQFFHLPNQDKNEIKFFNLANDSTIFLNSSNKIVYFKGLLSLINEEKIEALYSFNPNPKNFGNKKNKLLFQYTLISYDGNFKESFSNTLAKSDLTKYFIYFLLFLLIIEMILSNAKPSKSN